MFVNVLLEPLIVLFVNVSVVSFNTIVPVAFGIVTVLSASGFSTIKVVSFASAEKNLQIQICLSHLLNLNLYLLLCLYS